MRTAFIESLCEIASVRDDVVLLCGDLGFSVLERFADNFPGRYYNVGVAEQNMAGMAAGLALAGKTVVTYSIANFSVVRCLEQIRNDICYHNCNVMVVSVGSGVAYGSQGYTHHGIEDMAFTRVLPNMTVVSPGDPIETRWAVRALLERRGPAHLRLGRGGEPVVHSDVLHAGLCNAITVRSGGADAIFLSTGAILPEVMAAANTLRDHGLDVGVISVPVVTPLDEITIVTAAKYSRLLVTVEEHSKRGGLGSAVAEVLAGLEEPRARLLRTGMGNEPIKHAQDQNALRKINGIDRASLSNLVLQLLTPERRNTLTMSSI